MADRSLAIAQENSDRKRIARSHAADLAKALTGYPIVRSEADERYSAVGVFRLAGSHLDCNITAQR
jgi:hypothetical protein